MKSRVWLPMPVTYSTSGEDRKIFSDCWLNSLAKKASSVRGPISRFQGKYTRTMPKLHMFIAIFIHTLMFIYVHTAHTHTHYLIYVALYILICTREKWERIGSLSQEFSGFLDLQFWWLQCNYTQWNHSLIEISTHLSLKPFIALKGCSQLYRIDSWSGKERNQRT